MNHTLSQTMKDTTTALRETIGVLAGTGRDLFYAGLGLFAMIEEETRDGFDALVRAGQRVDRGEARTLTAKAYAEAEGEVREVEQDLENAGRTVEAAADEVETRLVETIAAVLHRMNVPTHDDVEALKRSVDRLNKKALALRAA